MTKKTYEVNTPTIECHRMGALRGGMNWGCCAVEVMQNFSSDPDAAAVQAMWVGDSPDRPVTGGNSTPLYLGPTNKDVFLGRLRVGTFGQREQPNHIFLASISANQMRQANTKKWLEIMKAEGFIFLGGCSNSVYSGANVSKDPNVKATNKSPVYLFGLFRNIGEARLDDPFAPPAEWNSIPEPTTTQLERWLAGKTTFYNPTPEELKQLDAYEDRRRTKIGLKPRAGKSSADSNPAELSTFVA
jgi:hypothetical protein